MQTTTKVGLMYISPNSEIFTSPYMIEWQLEGEYRGSSNITVSCMHKPGLKCKNYHIQHSGLFNRPSTFCKVGDFVPLGGRSTGTG